MPGSSSLTDLLAMADRTSRGASLRGELDPGLSTTASALTAERTQN